VLDGTVTTYIKLVNYNTQRDDFLQIKRNMLVTLKIGFNNDLITNSFYTKFLGMAIDNNLSWNNHIDLLMKELSMACYIIKNAKTYTSASSLKMIYHSFFHSAMSYGIIFWGNSSHSSTIFSMQKKAIRITEGCENRDSCTNLFKKLQILLLTLQYMLSLLMFVVQNKNLFSTSIENHNIDVRQRDNLYLPQANLTIYQKEAYYSGIKIFNNLPLETKNVSGNQRKFKNWSKNIYILINFIHWKSTFVNHELYTVSQDSLLYWY